MFENNWAFNIRKKNLKYYTQFAELTVGLLKGWLIFFHPSLICILTQPPRLILLLFFYLVLKARTCRKCLCSRRISEREGERQSGGRIERWQKLRTECRLRAWPSHLPVDWSLSAKTMQDAKWSFLIFLMLSFHLHHSLQPLPLKPSAGDELAQNVQTFFVIILSSITFDLILSSCEIHIT